MTLFKKFLSLMLVSTLVMLVACEEKVNAPEPTPEPEAPVLNLKTTEVNAAAEGEMFTLMYTVTNPVQDAVITATCRDSWINKLDYSVPGEISFYVAANNSNDPRSTTITVAYSALEETETIVVNQEGSTAAAFTISNIVKDDTSLTFDVSALNRELEYVIRVYTKEYIDAFELHSDEDFFYSDIETMRYEARNSQQSLQNYIMANSYIGDCMSYKESDLQPKTEYIVFCYHIDAYATKLVGDIHRESMTTADTVNHDEPQVTFDMQFEIDGPYVKQTIIPSDEDVFYYYGCWSEDDFYRYFGADAVMADIFPKRWHETIEIQKSFGLSLSQIIEQFCLMGTNTLEHNELNAATDYVFFAFAIDEYTGFASSDTALFYVTTEEPQLSDMTIYIVVSDIMSTAANVVWTASDPEGAFARGVLTKEEWNAAGSTDAARLDTFIRDYSFFEAVGTTDMNLSNLTPDTEYVAMAYGVEGGKPTTNLFYIEFKTAAAIVGKSVLTLSWDGYYVLGDLAAYDPAQWGSYAGVDYTALLPVDIKVEPYAYDIFYYAYPTISDYYTDDQWLTVLKSYQQYDRNHYNFYLTIDSTYTLIGVAKDNDGNFGPLFKQEITPTIEGASPAESLVYKSNN